MPVRKTWTLSISSASDQTVAIYTPEGVTVKIIRVKAGEVYIIDNLTRGIYIVAGRKITVK